MEPFETIEPVLGVRYTPLADSAGPRTFAHVYNDLLNAMFNAIANHEGPYVLAKRPSLQWTEEKAEFTVHVRDRPHELQLAASTAFSAVHEHNAHEHRPSKETITLIRGVNARVLPCSCCNPMQGYDVRLTILYWLSPRARLRRPLSFDSECT